MATQFAIDARSAATFRVAIATCLLLELAGSWPDRCDFHSSHQHYCVAASLRFMLHALSGICMVAGWHPNASALVAAAMQMSLIHASPATQTGDSLLLCTSLLWAALLPNIGACWAVRISLPAVCASHLPAFGFKLHLVLFYMSSVAHKLNGTHGDADDRLTDAAYTTSPWQSGTAVLEALRCCEYQRPLGRLLLRQPRVCMWLTYVTIACEGLVPAALLLLDSAPRLVAWLLLVGLHVGMHLCMDLDNFSAICIATLCAFLPSDAWLILDTLCEHLRLSELLGAAHRPLFAGAGQHRHRSSSSRAHLGNGWDLCLERLRVGVAAFFLICAIATTADSHDPSFPTHVLMGDHESATALMHLASFGRALGFPASADMFAPPPRECGWWVLPATKLNGVLVDAHRLRHRPHLPVTAVSYARPTWPATQHGSLLWRRLYEKLSSTAHWIGDAQAAEWAAVRSRVALSYCDHNPGLREVELIFVSEIYEGATSRVGRVERRSLARADCIGRTANGTVMAANHPVSRSALLPSHAAHDTSHTSSGASTNKQGPVLNGMLHLFDSSMSTSDWRTTAMDTTRAAHLVTKTGEVVMAVDEAPYMKLLAQAATSHRRGARVLEVGFGMGISARYLAEMGAALHVVAEPNRNVYKSALDHAAAVAPTVLVVPIHGFWQEVTPWLSTASFDSILYDAFPDAADAAFLREARRLLRPGGVLTFYHSTCDQFASGRECEGWPQVVMRLREAGWQLGIEIPPTEPEAIVLQIDNTCQAQQRPGSCGSRPRTFVVPVITRASDAEDHAIGAADNDIIDDDNNRDYDSGISGALTSQCGGIDGRERIEERTASISTRRGGWRWWRWQQHDGNRRSGASDTSPLPATGATSGHLQELFVLTQMAREPSAAAPGSHAHRGGRLLEMRGVADGLGLSSAQSEQHQLDFHSRFDEVVVVEVSAQLARFASYNISALGIRILLGHWADVFPLLRSSSFDAIIGPNQDAPTTDVQRRTFAQHVYRLLAPGGVHVRALPIADGAIGDSPTCADGELAAAERAAAIAADFVASDVNLTFQGGVPLMQWTKRTRPPSDAHTANNELSQLGLVAPDSPVPAAGGGLIGAHLLALAPTVGGVLALVLALCWLWRGTTERHERKAPQALSQRPPSQVPPAVPSLHFGRFKLALGALLVCDALQRGLLEPTDSELLHARAGVCAVRGLHWAQAVIGTALAAAGVLCPSCHALCSSLGVAGYSVSIALYRTEPRAYYCGDLLVRWMLVWLCVLPSRRAYVGYVLQLALMYGVSLTYKNLNAYLFEGHALRSLLLTEGHAAPASPLWQLAARLAFSPMGPYFSRAAWTVEFVASLSGCAVVIRDTLEERRAFSSGKRRARPEPMRTWVVCAHQTALGGGAVLQLVIFLTCNMGLLPHAACVLHLGAHDALSVLNARGTRSYAAWRSLPGRRLGEADSGPRSTEGVRSCWRDRLAVVLLGVVFTQVLLERTLPEQPYTAHYQPFVRTVGLSQLWNMFSLEDSELLTSGRTVTFVSGKRTPLSDLTSAWRTTEGRTGRTEGEEHSRSGEEHNRSSEYYEFNLLTLTPRSPIEANAPVADFGIGVTPDARSAFAARRSFRWLLYEQKRDSGFGSEADEKSLEGRAACASAQTLWETGRLAGPPLEVEQFEVRYDLPRLSGVSGTREFLRTQEAGASDVPVHVTSAIPTTWGRDATTGAWGAWPRTVVAVGILRWDCERDTPITGPLVSFAFEEGTQPDGGGAHHGDQGNYPEEAGYLERFHPEGSAVASPKAPRKPTSDVTSYAEDRAVVGAGTVGARVQSTSSYENATLVEPPLDSVNAAAFVGAHLASLPVGSVEALNAAGLLHLLSGDELKAAASFHEAWSRGPVAPNASSLATAKNQWWIAMTSGMVDSNAEHLEHPRSDADAKLDAAEENVYATFNALRTTYTSANTSDHHLLPIPALSVFDLPPQRRICNDPFFYTSGGRSGGNRPSAWRERYLDMLKRSLTNHLYRPQHSDVERLWDLQQGATGVRNAEVPLHGHTVMRVASLTHLKLAVDDVVARGVPGDVLQAGVFRGGAGVLLRAAIDTEPERTLWLADSFMGIPQPRSATAHALDETASWTERYVASEAGVRDVFRRYGFPLSDGRVRLLQGYFNETLRTAPIARPLALLHIDADAYDSVLDVLWASYERVAPGGYVVIDDFHLHGVRAAVDRFRRATQIRAPLLPVPSDRVSTCSPDLRQPGSRWSTLVTPLSAAYWIKPDGNIRHESPSSDSAAASDDAPVPTPPCPKLAADEEVTPNVREKEASLRPVRRLGGKEARRRRQWWGRLTRILKGGERKEARGANGLRRDDWSDGAGPETAYKAVDSRCAAEGSDICRSLVTKDHVLMGTIECENLRDLARVVVTSHDVLSMRHGRLLEVGYGLGLFADAVQALGVREHVVVEANMHVMRRLIASAFGARKGVSTIMGLWWEVVPTLADDIFDSILFNPYPSNDDQKVDRVAHQRGFMRHAYRLLKPGGVFSYTSCSARDEDIAADRAAAFQAGFPLEGIHIAVKKGNALRTCETSPGCDVERIPFLITRLRKPAAPEDTDVKAALVWRVPSAASLADVLDQPLSSTTGHMLAPVPVLDAALFTMQSDELLRRIRDEELPLVVRGHPQAMALANDTHWQEPSALCVTHPQLCTAMGSTWRWRGGQMSYRDDERLNGDDDSRYSPKYGVSRTSVRDEPLERFIAGRDEQKADAAVQVVVGSPADATSGASSTWTRILEHQELVEDPSISEALLADGDSVSNQNDMSIVLRLGQDTYMSNLHIDLIDNRILAVAGMKRAVVVVVEYEYEMDAVQRCLRLDTNNTRESFRQSPLPVLKAREWLAERCPAEDIGKLRALQHVFARGDLLFLPAGYAHCIQTKPGDHGWHLSLNLFQTRPSGHG